MEKFFEGTTAIIGATNNQERFGFKIYNVLKKRYPNLNIIPINPKCDFIEDIACLDSIDEITEAIDTVVLIVNPKIGFEIVNHAFNLGVKKFWFQPGAESEKLRTFCEEHNLLFSMDMCLLH